MDAFPNVVLFRMFPAPAAESSFGVNRLYVALTGGLGLAALAPIVATKRRPGLPVGATPPGSTRRQFDDGAARNTRHGRLRTP